MKKYSSDITLLGSVLLLAIAGIFTLYSQESILENPSNRWVMQSFFLGFGLFLALIIRKTNYQALGDYALPLYGLVILFLILTLIPFIGAEIKGARRWIRIGPVGFQFSELAKLSTVILLAKYIELKEKDIEKIPTLLIAFGLVLVPMALILVQPDLGMAFSFAPILLAMLFVAGADLYHLGSVLFFFGISLLVPLFIEYHNIILLDPILLRLGELEKTDLIPAVRILRTDIWDFVASGQIPASIQGNDRSYLLGIIGNPSLFSSLQETILSIRYEYGGLLLRFVESNVLIIVLIVLSSLIATTLFILRITQGQSLSHLRKIYIPLGVLGISLLSTFMINNMVTIRHHQVIRVTAFINPEKFPLDQAYQIRASKAAIGSGQLAGKGFFGGDMTMGNRPLVPEAHTDFIFTSWSERTGFLGSVLALILLFSIPLRAIYLSYNARDKFGSLLAAGIAILLFQNIMINIGISLGMLPVTGLPLPFMSYGGSHLMTSMVALGILLSISRRRFAN